jgi:hypothetical protein
MGLFCRLERAVLKPGSPGATLSRWIYPPALFGNRAVGARRKPSHRFGAPTIKGEETMKYHSLLTANNGLNTPSINPCKLLEFGFLKLAAGESYSADI